jgi:hypothetical protein
MDQSLEYSTIVLPLEEGAASTPCCKCRILVLIDDKAKTNKRINGKFRTQMMCNTPGGNTYEILLVLNGSHISK